MEVSDFIMHISASGTGISNFSQCLSQLYLGIYRIESHQLLDKMFKTEACVIIQFHVQNFQLVEMQQYSFKVQYVKSVTNNV